VSDDPEAVPPVAPPVQASAPEPTAAGGFNWGLRPSSAAAPGAAPNVADAPSPFSPVTVPPAPEPEPPALIVPPVSVPVLPPVEPFVPVPPVPVPVLAEPPVLPPTQPLSWTEFAATQQQEEAPPRAQRDTLPQPPFLLPTAPSAVDHPTEAYTVQPWQPASASPDPTPTLATPPADLAGAFESADPAGAEHAADPADRTSAIDSLFGDHKFQEYDEVGVLATLQTLPATEATSSTRPEREPRGPLPTSQKVLMGVAGGLIGVLILIAMFFLGQHLGSAQAAEPKPSKTGSSATPTPAGTGGPAAPGVQQWTALQGGECIQPFSSAWAQTFTVVACSADHDAEMVFKGKLPDSSSVAYPTAASFQKQLTGLCSAPTAINYTAAAAVTDLQVSFSYPPNTAAWLTGDRTYYCFVDRVSGGNLPGDLAVAKTATAG
jgi:hypothetical protein